MSKFCIILGYSDSHCLRTGRGGQHYRGQYATKHIETRFELNLDGHLFYVKKTSTTVNGSYFEVSIIQKMNIFSGIQEVPDKPGEHRRHRK